jgi:hypothetical protein
MLFLGKCCILSLYHRIFVHMVRVRYQIYGTLLLALSLSTASKVVPISTGRDSPKKSAQKGADVTRLLLAVGVLKLVVDLVILYIPTPIVPSMNLSKRKKMSVPATFLTGSM